MKSVSGKEFTKALERKRVGLATDSTYDVHMTISQTTSPVNVEIIPSVPEQEPVLANLFELYAHDFSAFIDLELGADGRFGYEYLPLYWKESSRYPFLIKVNGHLAGFVFWACQLYIYSDVAFDIHYVNRQGNEISPR
jgi:hypothetical protein